MPPETPPGVEGLHEGAGSMASLKVAEGMPASQLICRVRPCEKPSPLISVLENEARIEVGPEKGQPGEPLRFDRLLHAHGPGEQEELFEVIRPAVLACLQGASCTIVAHGGPQCGKSYTLSGFFTHGQLHGLAPRSIQFIVEELEKASNEALDRAGAAPAVEASFFEVHQDSVSDLVPRSCPKVSMRETSQAPYVVMDSNLTAHRCDGAAGFNRLLDTYFTGLEHRKKGSHTCFQIAFLHVDGRPRSHLRFVEMAWPRPQASSATPNSGSIVPAQAKVVAALEQVLQGKLVSGPSSSQVCREAYRSSPLAMLLKPCFEGHSLLYFVYCLRLEHIQLPCLAAVAPLLAKLHLWLGVVRAAGFGPPTGSASSLAADDATAPKAGAKRTPPPSVPPLRLGGTHDRPQAAPEVMPGAGDCLSTGGSCSSRSSPGGKAPPAPVGSAAVPPQGQYALPAHEKAPVYPQKGNANAAGQPPPEETGHAEPPQYSEMDAQDLHMLQQCAELLEAKRRTADALRHDAARSTAVLRDLDVILGQLMLQRESTDDTGPNERETNFKILYERVYRSMQRTSDEARRMCEDIEVLNHFCGGSEIPPAYDSYNVKEQDVEQLVEHAQQKQKQPEVSVPSAAPAATMPAPATATPAPAVPSSSSKAAAPERAVSQPKVPHLALNRLPQEHPPQSEKHQVSSLGPPSPSSTSCCSSDRGHVDETIPQFGGASVSVTPPAPAAAAGKLQGQGTLSSTPGVPLGWSMAMQVMAPASLVVAPPQHHVAPHGSSISVSAAMPHTPPVPPLATHSGALPGGVSPLVHGAPPRRSGPLVSAPTGYDASPTPTRKGNSVVVSANVQEARGMVGRPEMQRSVSAVRLPGSSVSAQAAMGSLSVAKSHSTASLQTVAVRPATVAAPPQAALTSHVSPMLGTRSELAGVSPMRSSSVAAASAAPTAVMTASIAASSAGASPLAPNGRTITPVATNQGSLAVTRQGGPPRVAGGSSTNSRATAPAKSRGNASQPAGHSPSPVMLSRNVSASALRITPALKARGPMKQSSPSPERRTMASPLRAAYGSSVGVPAGDVFAAPAYGWSSPAPQPAARQASVGPRHNG